MFTLKRKYGKSGWYDVNNTPFKTIEDVRIYIEKYKLIFPDCIYNTEPYKPKKSIKKDYPKNLPRF
jgi:hypothetical protein